MNTLNLLTATLDDIIFEGRNKAYGAFVLRRLYSRHLTRAAIIACALCLLLVGVPLLVERIWPTVIVIPPTIEEPIEPQVVLLPKVAPPAPPAAATKQPVVVTPPRVEVPTHVVPDSKVIEPPKELPPVEVAPVIDPISPGVGGGTGAATDGVPGGTGVTPGGGSDSGAVEAPTTSAPFVYAEVMPTFVGGDAALRKYLQRNLHYPPEALRGGVSGKVFVSFVVNSNGAITDVEVVKGLGSGTDEEAMRVVRNMPAWTPGRQNHRAVSVRYTLPITFRYE